MPIEAPAGKIPFFVGVNPTASVEKVAVPTMQTCGVSGEKKQLKLPNGGITPKYVGSFALVTTSGTWISKIACGSLEVGEAPNTSAKFTPRSAALRACCVPFPRKSPVAVALKHLARPTAQDFIVSVVMT